MNQCHHCGSAALIKAGHNASGSQRFQCKHCQRHSTFAPQRNGYDDEYREQALKLYLAGNGLRRIGHLLHVTHQTVANWIRQYHHSQPAAPRPADAETIELDELFTFVQNKKTSSTS